MRILGAVSYMGGVGAFASPGHANIHRFSRPWLPFIDEAE